MSEYISGEQQRLVLEKLYRSTDSISSTKKFNDKYRGQLGTMGESSIKITDFARKMKKTDFLTQEVE
ncbi:hypothetical protein HON36_02265, partial [Candidatus Parcubacteria bacterium]|nr:hypothetical protein [Candidatus Parcubacteria bacterium]